MTPIAETSRKSSLPIIIISYLSFIVLAMPGALIGIAWPHMQTTFELPLDAVGTFFLATSIAYFAGSFLSGRLIARFGIAAVLTASASLTAFGLIGFALSPAWLLCVLFGFPLGFGGGLLDAAMNIYFAANFGPRLMNWLHANFGVGIILGPLLITAILKLGGTWQLSYLVVALLNIAVAITFYINRSRWKVDEQSPANATSAPQTVGWATLRLPVVWFGIALFFAYAGIEATASSWSYKLFTDSRHVAEDAAGVWVGIYGASFTVGRILFGFLVNRFKRGTLIRLCLIGSICGILLFWWNPNTILGFVGLLIYGFMLAPNFALLVTNTQDRLGPEHAPNAIGFQVAAASVGYGILPGLAGVLANRSNLEIIPPYLLVFALLMVALYEATMSPRLKVKFAPLAVSEQ